MEYQGIITGIGDKELGKNLIKPEYDAVINDFIIGKNTILEGLKLKGNILSAGTCILRGYRGIIEENITLDNKPYVYGKFKILCDIEMEDTFEIVTSDTVLTDDEEAGEYFLLLYNNGNSQVDSERYPRYSQYSVETDKVLDFAEIAETATTPTDLNEFGGIETDLHLTQPNRVVNTEYVHAQIDKEIGAISENLTNSWDWSNDYITTATLTLLHRSKLVVIINPLQIQYNKPYPGEQIGSIEANGGKCILFKTAFLPQKEIKLGTAKCDYSSGSTLFPAVSNKTVDVYINISGEICIGHPNDFEDSNYATVTSLEVIDNIGYECK